MKGIILGTRNRVQGVFYGWWIVASGFVIQTLWGGLLANGFTLYFLPLQAEFGWSRTLLAAVNSMQRVESGLLGPIEGWAVDKIGPRRIAAVGIFIFGGGFILFSTVHTVSTFFFAFALMALGTSLSGFLPILTSITNWFSHKRAMAMGIAMTGMSVGGLAVPALAWSITSYGWRPTAVASGLIIWAVGIPAAFVLRHKPEQYGYLPDGVQADLPGEQRQDSATADPKAKEASAADEGFSVKEALRTPAFWLLSFGHAFALAAVATVSLFLVPHLVQQAGLSLQAAGNVVAMLLAMNVVAQLGGGFVADRMNKRALLAICMLSHAVGLLFLAYGTTMPQLVLFALFHGLAWGVRAPTIQSIRADFFGRRAYATIYGFANLINGATLTAAPLFTGWLADLRGDYILAFTIMAVITGSGSVFFVFARRPVQRAAGGAEAAPSY